MQVTTKGKRASAALPTTPTTLVEVPVNYIPFVLMAIEELKMPYLWKSDADVSTAQTALTLFQEGLLMGVGEDIVKAVDRVYMAVRQQSAGEVFLPTAGGDPPSLPVTPPELPGNIAPGLLALVQGQQGLLPGGWFGLGTRPATFADIVKALRAGQPSEIETMLDKIDLLGDATDVATLYSAVKGTAIDLASLAEGGGTLATMIVATLANSAMMGLQAGQLDDLLARLDTLIGLLSPEVTP